MLPARADSELGQAIVGGKADVFVRYRFEYVSDAVPQLKNAYASTLRTALGYRSGSYHNLSFYLQLEDVRVLGNELFNDGGANGVMDRAVVVDPQGTEINQATLHFGGAPKTLLTVGRQEITHREPPFNRFLGNVAFRQNWQTYDAVRAVNLAVPHTLIDYAYIWNVNRIFGEDNTLPDAADFHMRSHALSLLYSGFASAKVEPYAYLLDFKDTPSKRFSTATYGLRVDGDAAILPKTKLLYAAEFAQQTDYADNPNDIDVNYLHAELGTSYAVGAALEAVSLKLSYELLAGDGGAQAFQTPLGTNHAFQGFADRFLVTPGDGIRDYYLTLGAKFFGAQLLAVYHHFTSDKDRYDYGREWNYVLEKSVLKNLLAGMQYADYRADRNVLNVSRNTASGQAFDLAKFWVYLQYRY